MSSYSAWVIFYFIARDVLLFDVWSAVWHAWLLMKSLLVRQAGVSKVPGKNISNPCY